MNTKALLAEFIGTAALVFVGAGAAAAGGDLVAVALAHGLILAGLAYAYGSISGTYVNPAVTLAMAMRGRIAWRDAAWYWVVQLAGGVFAAVALFFIFGAGSELGATTVASGVTPVQAIMVEAMLTFLLANAVLHTTEKKTGTPFAGVAIGLTLAAAILVGGPLTGASLNPARTLGPAIFTGTLSQLWIYLVGPVLGAALAAWAYRALKK
ncbi:MAG: aquaporin [Anaerolineales bacterium]